jgi:predicted GIY-YIG superfamily endonuclease
MEKEQYLYALVKDKKPIYIGVTNNIEKRKKNHSVDKDFDYIFVIKSYKTRKEALNAENAIVRFNGVFDIGLINARHAKDKYVYEEGYFENIERYNKHR